MLGSLSLSQAVAFATSRTGKNGTAVLAAGLVLALVIGLPQTVLCVLFLPSTLPTNLSHLSSIVQYYSLFPLLTYCLGVFSGRDEGLFAFSRFYLFLGLQSAGNCLGIVLAWLGGVASVAILAASQIISGMAVLTSRLFIARSDFISARPNADTARTLLRQGTAFHFPQVAAIIAGQADMLLAVTLLPPEQLGFYVVALAIARGQLGFVSALVQVSFVRIAGTADRSAAIATLVQVFKASQVVAIAIATLFILATPLMLEYGFGSSFLQAKSVTIWLVAAVALAGVYHILDQGLRALGHSFVSTTGNVFVVAVQLGAGYAIVPRTGIEAIAYLKCAGHLLAILMVCLHLVFFQKVTARNLIPDRSTVRQLSSTAFRLLASF